MFLFNLNSSLTLDFTNASSDVQNVNTLLQKLLDKFYPIGFDFIKDTLLGNWSASNSSIYTISKTSTYLKFDKIATTETPQQIICNKPVEITGDNLSIAGSLYVSEEGNAGSVTLSTIMYIQISKDNSNWTTISNTFSSTKTTGVNFNQEINVSQYKNQTLYFRIYIYNSWSSIKGGATFNTFKIS